MERKCKRRESVSRERGGEGGEREKAGMQRAKASHPPLVCVISWGRARYQGKSCCVVRSADSFVSSAPYCRGSVDGGRFQREWENSGVDV